MIVSVPHCGSIQYMAKDACERLGLGYLEAPGYSERTVDIGVSISPEHVCFPCKVLIGSAVESLEAGADTLVTAAGFGPCRFNYFAEIERRILEREGYDFRIITFDGIGEAPLAFYRNMRSVVPASSRRLGGMIKEMALVLRKGWAYDEIDKLAIATRALEVEDGATDLAAAECLSMLDGARTKNEIEAVRAATRERFAAVPVDRRRPHLRVGVVGEMLMSMEPYFNFDVVRWLTRRGAVVECAQYSSDIFTPMGRNPVLGYSADEIRDAASPYLGCEVGGHGHISVGATVMFARRGFDAVVHLFPFTCLPEVIAKTIFVRVSNEFGMPILSMSIDEQTGRAGMQTRLEALVDLAWSTKNNRGVAAEYAGARA
jgi:predicted nucleotide-binding protein (sugar kinase/HSP70/actin superfamily)